ncbi:MAG: hypothetical protein ACI87E_003128 [Mariniblastus sp.]|jgi:hypothetical protein
MLMNSLDVVIAARDNSMKVAWIAGRCLLALLVLSAVVVSLGSDWAPSSLNEIQDSDSASDDKWTSTVSGKAEDLLKDWEKPKFVLMVTGRQHGYMEPCGCITLARQKGGLMRRHTVQKILQDRGWDVIPIDAGNQVRRFGQQPVLKLRKTYDALCKEMEYNAIGLGPDDLKLPAINLAQILANVMGPESPFICANVDLMGMNAPFVVINRGGKKIGVTMILGDEHLESIKQQNVTTQSVAAGLTKAVGKLQQENCDMKVLIAFTDLEKCRALAKQFPVFDLLVTAGGAGDPTLEPELIKANNNHQTPMIQVGVKGMHVGLVGFYEDNGQNRIEYERVELDHRYKDSEKIKTIFKSYQDDLKALWENGLLKDIAPRDHPSGRSYVGSSSCADCHEDEFAIWEDGVDGNGGPHEKATRDLEQNPNDDRVWVQRHFDPECISCHATGWNPQKFYPYKSGFLKMADEDLHGNGCENCHGPGSAHVAIEQLAGKQQVNVDERIQRAREMHLSVSKSATDGCKECHDLDNSPDFLLEGGFAKYWPQVQHGRPAAEKIQDLFESVLAQKRPLADVARIEDWLVDMESQSPTQVGLVENAMEGIRTNPANAANIMRSVLEKLVVD